MSNNFGDNLNYEIVKFISGKEPMYAEDRMVKDHYLVCGSIITEANKFSTICGVGFGGHDYHIPAFKDITSVRGELSREKIGVPNIVVGDPAILMPYIYYPAHRKSEQPIHKFGIIPHWKDVEYLTKQYPQFYFINPLKPSKEVIDDICRCENIISSSLHGLILADAYEVPNAYFDSPIDIGGDGFKFEDYYSTTDRPKVANNFDFFVSNYKYDKIEFLKSFPFYAQR